MSDRQEDSGWWLASDGKWYPPESHPSVRAESAAPRGVRYAGFWLRVWAFLIDGIIVSIGVGIVASILGIDEGGFFSTEPGGTETLLDLAAGWLYFGLMESSSSQATVGKMALSLKVTDIEGRRVSFGRATGRHFGKIVSALILLIGFMMAGWTAKKQALHDLMAETLVVRAPR